jgi:hypothetical protein
MQQAAFSPPPKDLRPQTVHAIKGEDRDAVMVVVRRPHASDPAKQLELFETALSGDEIGAALPVIPPGIRPPGYRVIARLDPLAMHGRVGANALDRPEVRTV